MCGKASEVRLGVLAVVGRVFGVVEGVRRVFGVVEGGKVERGRRGEGARSPGVVAGVRVRVGVVVVVALEFGHLCGFPGM